MPEPVHGGVAARITAVCQAPLPEKRAALPTSPERRFPSGAAHLYACQSLSTYQIAAITAISRHRIVRLLRQAGIAVKPRGAGRRKARGDAEAERLDALMADLYLRLRLPSTQITELTGIPDRSVRDRLRAHGVPMRTRGRCNREDRIIIPPEDLADLVLAENLIRAG